MVIRLDKDGITVIVIELLTQLGIIGMEHDINSVEFNSEIAKQYVQKMQHEKLVINVENPVIP